MQAIIDRFDRRNLRRWIGPYIKQRLLRPRTHAARARHLLFCLCDHYEPLHGKVDPDVGDRRVAHWESSYPALAARFRDGDGLPPRHSFFFAAEEYRQTYLERLTRLVAAGLGEVELHLHHDQSSAEGLERDLGDYLGLLRKHGHLSTGPDGRPRFGFIHGNWCLANSRPDGSWCGIDEELEVLWKAGCYADFTFPSAPDVTQPPLVNQIYWPRGDLTRRAAHEEGEVAAVGRHRDDRPLMIPGPLAITWDRKRRKPRIENGAITGSDPGTRERVDTWVAQDIHVVGRPEWVFVKVHTHGAPEDTAASLLHDGGVELHDALQRYNDGDDWVLHYVTARELYNIAMAAIDGEHGDPHEFRDYLLSRPAAAAASIGQRAGIGGA